MDHSIPLCLHHYREILVDAVQDLLKPALHIIYYFDSMMMVIYLFILVSHLQVEFSAALWRRGEGLLRSKTEF